METAGEMAGTSDSRFSVTIPRPLEFDKDNGGGGMGILRDRTADGESYPVHLRAHPNAAAQNRSYIDLTLNGAPIIFYAGGAFALYHTVTSLML